MYNVLVTEVSELFGYNNQMVAVEVDPSLASRPDELIRRAAGKDALVIRNVTKADSSLISRLRESTPVRVIGRLGVGLDNIDVPAARQAGLQVVYTPDANTESTAQYAFAQILSATRHLAEAHTSTVAGQWNRAACMGRELSELTVGIIGFGRIGRRLANILNFMGSRILVAEPFQAIPPPFISASLPELFSSADVISVHVPLTPGTRGFVGSELLQLMRSHAILVNSSRGEVVREQELEAFLRQRPDVTAVLDVRCEEPPKDQLFRDLPNVRLAPHIAAFTTAAQKQVFSTVMADVERVLAGGSPLWPAP
jgi:phosphoglycerate dehydrogenase-like enzyme